MVRNYVRKTDRFKWSTEDLERAAQAHKVDGESVRKAAAKYGVPNSTLLRFIKGNCATGQSGRIKPVFNAAQETELENYLIKCQEMAYGLTASSVKKACL